MTRASGDAAAVAAYFAEQPEPQRTTLLETWARFRGVLPEGVEAMSYGMPTLKLGGKSIGSIAGFRHHCSYFPHSGSLLAGLGNALARYDADRGTLRFAIDRPLPKTVLRTLVRAKVRDLGL